MKSPSQLLSEIPQPDSPKNTYSLINLVSHATSVPGRMPLAEVHQAFQKHVWRFMAVEENGRVTGLCSREKVSSLLASQFNHTIYAKKAVRDFLLPHPEIITQQTLPRDAFSRAFARPGESFYHDIVLVDAQQQLIGLIPIDALVRLQNLMLTERIAELEESRQHLARQKTQLTELSTQLSDTSRELVSARDKAIEGTRLKSQFLANMSHEIRTPMNGILGTISLLTDTLHDEEQRSHCATIRKGANTLLQLIDDILDFSEIEAGRLEICADDIPIRELVEECLIQLTEELPCQSVEILIDIDPAIPEWVHLDPRRYRQILINLVSNALKFTPDGEVTVTLRLLHLPEKGHFLQTEVKDTGIGIPSSLLNKLFEPFTQADGSNSRRYGGTGLGLAICRRLATLMEGSLTCASDEGTGSTFWLTLPLQSAPSPMRPARPLPTGLRALIVEDHPTASALIARQIAACGVRCTTNAHPDQAFLLWKEAVAAGEPFHWIFLNEHLATNAQFFKTLSLLEANQRPRFILIQAPGDPDQPKSLDLRFVPDRILFKPIGPVILADVLQKTCPTIDSSNPAITSPIEPSRPLALRILLAEDNSTNQEVALQLLNRLGCETFIAENGLQALQILREQLLDCILMDCQMPQMDGFETTRAIRKGFHGISQTTIPIIAMTAHNMPGDRQRCLQAGMDAYLSKPLSVEQLQAALLKLCPTTAS